MDQTAARLFVYGTLLAPEVLHALLGRFPSHRPAVLQNYARWQLTAYPTIPAIVQSENSIVEGNLLEDLSLNELAILDYYEDEGYERRQVDVICDGASVNGVFAYCWPSTLSSDLSVGIGWSYDEFREERLAAFVTDIVVPVSHGFNQCTLLLLLLLLLLRPAPAFVSRCGSVARHSTQRLRYKQSARLHNCEVIVEF